MSEEHDPINHETYLIQGKWEMTYTPEAKNGVKSLAATWDIPEPTPLKQFNIFGFTMKSAKPLN